MSTAQLNTPVFEANWAASHKECAICREPKATKEFVHYKGRHTNKVCKTCWHTDQEKVLDFFMRTDAPTRMHTSKAKNVLLALARRRITKGREGIQMTAEEYAAKVARLPDRIAAIVGKTFKGMGDAFEVDDYTAIEMIWDWLEDIDESLIERNKHKRLSRLPFKVRMR